MNALLYFLQTNLRNSWISQGPLSIYVRKGVHLIDGVSRQTLDVANINCIRMGEGYFTTWLSGAEKAAKDYGMYGVYVENVLNERLPGFLERNGYALVSTHEVIDKFTPPDQVSPCYIKKF